MLLISLLLSLASSLLLLQCYLLSVLLYGRLDSYETDALTAEIVRRLRT
jgi:hypothetical protein